MCEHIFITDLMSVLLARRFALVKTVDQNHIKQK